jgi:virulence-associated protein VagC
MEVAHLFENGHSQAVRLPDEFRFAGDRVYIKRVGRAISTASIASAKTSWMSASSR